LDIELREKSLYLKPFKIKKTQLTVNEVLTQSYFYLQKQKRYEKSRCTHCYLILEIFTNEQSDALTVVQMVLE